MWASISLCRIATCAAERDVTADLKGALASIPVKSHAAITEPKQAGELMRSIQGYSDHPYATAALKLSPLLFVRPGEFRVAEWKEIDLDAAEWRITNQKQVHVLAALRDTLLPRLIAGQLRIEESTNA